MQTAVHISWNPKISYLNLFYFGNRFNNIYTLFLCLLPYLPLALFALQAIDNNFASSFSWRPTLWKAIFMHVGNTRRSLCHAPSPRPSKYAYRRHESRQEIKLFHLRGGCWGKLGNLCHFCGFLSLAMDIKRERGQEVTLRYATVAQKICLPINLTRLSNNLGSARP